MRGLLWLFAACLSACAAPRGVPPAPQPEQSTWYQRQGRHPVDPGQTIGKVGLLNAWAVPCGIDPLQRSELIVHATAALGDNTSRLVADITVAAGKAAIPSSPAFCAAVRAEHGEAARRLDQGDAPAALPAVPTIQEEDAIRSRGSTAGILARCPGGMPEPARYRELTITDFARRTGRNPDIIAGIFDAGAIPILDRPSADLCDMSRRLARHTLHGTPVGEPLGGPAPPRPIDHSAPPGPKAPEPKRLIPGQSTPQLDI